jgi:hypothetical protein
MNHFRLSGVSPSGDSRQVFFTRHGEDLTIRIIGLDSDESVSVQVPVAAFQAETLKTSFSLAAVDQEKRPVQVSFLLQHNMIIAINGLSVEVNMDELRDGLVMLGVLPDSQPYGIETSMSMAKRGAEYST